MTSTEVNKSFSVNYPGFKLNKNDYVIKLEKVLDLFTKRKGTHDEIKEFGSPLHAFIGTFVNDQTLQAIEESCRQSISLWCPDFQNDVEVSVKKIDSSSFLVRVAIDRKYVDISSNNLI